MGVAMLGLVGATAFVLAHAQQRPVGCGSSPLPGGTSAQTLEFGGRVREFQLHVPERYDPEELTAVVLHFHGWGGSGTVGWMRPDADLNNYIVVAPTGVGRGNNPDGGANSWNGGGSTTSPGPAGPSCAPGSPEYCYDSCAARPEGCHPCDWTTCSDDFAFVDSLLDWLQANLCVDPARIFATGHSNGGQFVWALASRLASGRLAAIAPSAGTPHTGFGEGPQASPVSVMDVHGINDDICPANSTEPSVDGWYYEQVPIMCEIFSRADGCDPEVLQHYPTSFDHQNELCEIVGCALSLVAAASAKLLHVIARVAVLCSTADCMQQGRCEAENIDVVRCAWNGGHGMYGSLAPLVWEFFQAHPKQIYEEGPRLPRPSAARRVSLGLSSLL